MAKGQKSVAQQIREARGIEQEKNERKAAAGRKGAIVTNAKNKGISVDDEENRLLRRDAGRLGAIKKHNAALNEQLTANIARIQEFKKQAGINHIRENVDKVSKRLVKLALGQDEFKNSPASVQRLAMLDVLSIGGISADTTGQQETQKKISDLSANELIALIDNAKSLIEKGKEQALDDAIDVTPQEVGE